MELPKVLKAIDLFSIAFGSIIGWGVFTLTADWFEMSGPWGTFIAAYLSMLMILPIAFTYSYLIQYIPKAGGEHIWALKAFGHFQSFIAGWWLFIGYLSIVILNVTAFPVWLRTVAPRLVEWGYLYTVAKYNVYAGYVLFSFIIATLFYALNYFGVQISGLTQRAMALTLVASGTLYVILCFLGGSLNNTWDPLPWSLKNGVLGGVLAWLAIAPWAYVGFDTVPQAIEEARMDPRKANTVLVLAIAAGASFYAFITLATAAVAPWNTFLGTWLATATAAQRVAGSFGLGVVFTGALMGILTGINGFMIASSRLLYAMAKEGFLPRALEDIHPKHRTPHKAVTIVYILTLLTIWFGRDLLVLFVNVASLGTAIAYTYVGFALYKLRKEVSQNNDADGKKLGVIGIISGFIGATFVGLILMQLSFELLILAVFMLFASVALYTLYIRRALKLKAPRTLKE